MPLTNFPAGITTFGMPILGTGGVVTTGNMWFVNSALNGNGKTPGGAFTTLTQANGAATASNGDVVFIMPGHTEAITSATSFGSLSKAGVRYIGLGYGSSRPTFTLSTATTATINVTAANISIENCRFIGNFADIVAYFTTTTAKNFTLLNNDFIDTSSSLNVSILVDTNATSNDTDGLTIVGNNYYGLGATAGSALVKMDGTNDRITITNNYFTNACVGGAALMPIATTKVVTNLKALDNIFAMVQVTSLTTGILITTDTGTNSGMIARNLIQGLDATTEILVTAASGFVFSQNYYAGVADKSGYLLPQADA